MGLFRQLHDHFVRKDQRLVNATRRQESVAVRHKAVGRALADFRESLKHHPGFGPSLAMLEELGETP